MATDKPRFSLTMDDSLLEMVENYQIKHGYSTKSRAIQALVKAGLDDMHQEERKKTKKSPSLEDGDEEILNMYHRLDSEDKLIIKGEMRGLLLHEKYREKSDVSVG